MVLQKRGKRGRRRGGGGGGGGRISERKAFKGLAVVAIGRGGFFFVGKKGKRTGDARFLVIHFYPLSCLASIATDTYMCDAAAAAAAVVQDPNPNPRPPNLVTGS